VKKSDKGNSGGNTHATKNDPTPSRNQRASANMNSRYPSSRDLVQLQQQEHNKNQRDAIISASGVICNQTRLIRTFHSSN
jgi:hypothetical protein